MRFLVELNSFYVPCPVRSMHRKGENKLKKWFCLLLSLTLLLGCMAAPAGADTGMYERILQKIKPTATPEPAAEEETAPPSETPAPEASGPEASAPETEEPAGKDAPSDAEPDGFAGGYIRVPAGTPAYGKVNAAAPAGYFAEDAHAWADPAGRGWAKISFTDKAKKAVRTLYLPLSGVKVLSGAETTKLTVSLMMAKAAKQDGHYLPTAKFSEAAVPKVTPTPNPTRVPAPTDAPPAPTAPAAPTEEPAGFASCYLSIPAGTEGYAKAALSARVGYFPKAATVYAEEMGNGWFRAYYADTATRKAASVCICPAEFQVLSGTETAKMTALLLLAKAPVRDGHPLANAEFKKTSGTMTPSPTPAPALSVAVSVSAWEVSLGDQVVLTASVQGAEGKNVLWQWECSLDGRSDWKSPGLPGEQTDTLSFGATKGLLAFSYRCRAVVGKKTLYSEPVKVRWDGTQAMPVYRALLIGQSNYAAPLSRLTGTVHDANTMAGMLGGLSNSFSTRVVTDRTASQIRSDIRSAFAGAAPRDVSLLFYSGHGCADEGAERGALMGVDGSKLTMASLARELSQVSGRVIVVFDSCYSGASVSEKGSVSEETLSAILSGVVSAFSYYNKRSSDVKAGELADGKFVVLAAARIDELSGETRINGYRCGIFTYALTMGMGCTYPSGAYMGVMPADDGDLQVTLGEIYQYAYREALRLYPMQHAVCYGNRAEVLFSRK